MKKINESSLKKLIIQEMHGMMHGKAKPYEHHEMMDAVLHAAGGCPIRAKSMLMSMLGRIEPMAHEREMQLQSVAPNPATSGEIPRGERLMGDDAYMEQKKPTAVDGPGIFGPGFR